MNYKNKTVLVVDNGLFVSWAELLAKSFGKVLYYSPWECAFPKSNARMIGEGLPGVTRVNEFWSLLDDIDLCFFPDVYQGALQVHLEHLGKPVWGSRLCEALELDRVWSKNLCKKAGIDIGNYQVVVGLDALREYLQEHDEQWVKISLTRGDMESFRSKNYKLIEPRIDELEHTLGAKKKVMEFIVEDAIDPAVETGCDLFTIDGKFPDNSMFGIEIKDKAYILKTSKYADIPEEIRSVNGKLSDVFRMSRFRGFWSTELRITPERVPYLIDPCFSEDTEILTDKGWKLFQDLDKSEAVATLNTSSGEIEYQHPTDYVAHRFSGDMISISNKERGIECLVTPNHGVWRTDRNGNGLFRQRADSLTDKGFIPRTGAWNSGHSLEYFTLPAYTNTWTSGRSMNTVRKYHQDALEIPIKDWLRFLAVYLGDGSCADWQVSIKQTDASTKKELVAQVVNALPMSVSRESGRFAIHSTQLAAHIREMGFGYSYQKFIPDYVKQLNSDLIDVFLEAYRLCDGGEHKGQNLYYTTSKQLADDLQELVFKAGRLANIRVRRMKGTTMQVLGGKTYTRNHDQYVVSEVAQQNRFWFEAAGARRDRYFSKVPYDGMVYDVRVPNQTVYVRRNGKPFWSSNCPRAGSPPSELYQNQISNWADIIWEGAHGTLVEPKFRAKWGAELLIHSAFADKNWLAVEFPKSMQESVKLRNCCKIEGKYYIAPQWTGMPEIGAVVALGDSQESAIKECLRLAQKVEGHYIDVFNNAFDAAADEIAKLKDYGIGGF